jgi:hypothetical protein
VAPKTYKNKGVCHNTLKGPLPFTYKEFLMAKEELWTLKNISPCILGSSPTPFSFAKLKSKPYSKIPFIGEPWCVLCVSTSKEMMNM